MTTTENPSSLSLDLDELTSMLEEASPARIVVAADWSKPSTAYAAMTAFAAMVGPEDAVELVLTVPHEPGEEDLQCVRVLLDEAEVNQEIGGVQIESFTETANQPYAVSVVPLGDERVVSLELVSATVLMHQVLTGKIEASDRNAGDQAALARRLATFAEQL